MTAQLVRASGKALDAERGLVWLAPSKVDNTYALAMRQADATRKGIRSISDLALWVNAGNVHRLASTVEFITRPDGLKPLEQAYGFQFGYGNVVGMDNAGIYAVLRRPSEYDVGVVLATDGRTSELNSPCSRTTGTSSRATSLPCYSQDDTGPPPADKGAPGKAVESARQRHYGCSQRRSGPGGGWKTWRPTFCAIGAC
jgi:hypothetical protein